MVKSKGKNLHDAKKAKNDEFYTMWRDIENEMNAYRDYDENVFRDKVVLLPCDDPEWSNFTRYFAHNFELFGIKKLISTSYAQASNPAIDEHEPSNMEVESDKYDPDKSWERGKIFILERGDDRNGDGRVNFHDMQWSYLDGDGDFRSDEVTALRDEADIVVTNPPFSLFREFMAWLVEGNLDFSVIGNSNAITYKEIFPLIKGNRLWLGATGNSNDMVFRVPEGVEVRDSDRDKAARLGYPSTDTEFYTRMGNSCWFSNIQHGRRHKPLELLSMADNLKYSRRKKIREEGYPEYDNYDAIEVGFTEAIPSDYEGVMGVPISFLGKYNPDQFEIIKFRHGDDGKDLRVNGKTPYFRILLRHKN